MKLVMRFLGCLIVLGALATACGGDPDLGGVDGRTSEDTSSASTGLETTTAMTDSGQSSTSTTEATATTVDPPGTDSSSGLVDDSSSQESSTTGCTPGELDCGCDSGNCAEGLECVDDVCGEISGCQDDEYGDITTEATAHFLGEINDDDDDGGTVVGVLTGPDDVDWFRYDGTDSVFNTVDPFRTIVSSAPVRFCKFASCPGPDGIADTEFPCEDDAVATTSPDGRPGCCAESLIHVPDANCSGTIDDDMAVWIRVDQTEEVCVSYAFDYHF